MDTRNMKMYTSISGIYGLYWLGNAVALVLIAPGTHCKERVFTGSPEAQILFAHDDLELLWLTSFPDEEILWCYWKYELGGAWDQFIGYHNVDRKRLNISPWNNGWVFTNDVLPCHGGISRRNVTSDYSGGYVMVIADMNGTEYESIKYILSVIDCPRPRSIPGADVIIIAHDTKLEAVYKCTHSADGTNGMTVQCDREAGTWDSIQLTCNLPGKVSPLEISLAVTVVLLCSIIVCLVLRMRRCFPCPQNLHNYELPLRKSDSNGRSNSIKLKKQKCHLEFAKVFHNYRVNFKETLPLSVVVRSRPSAKIQWYKDNQELLKSSKIHIHDGKRGDRCLEIHDVTGEDSGLYSVKATNGVCDPIEYSRHITVVTSDMIAPKISEILQNNLTVYGGETCTFPLCTINGNPTPSVTCYKNDTPLGESDNIRLQTSKTKDALHVTLLFNNLSIDDVCDLRMRTENIIGHSEFRVKLEVKVRPKILELKNVEVHIGEDVTMEAVIQGFPAPSVEWLKGNKVLDSSKLRNIKESTWISQLHLENVQQNMAGQIKVLAKDDKDNTSQKTATIKLKRDVKPSFQKPLESKTVKEGDNIEFSVTLDGYPIPDIEWCKDKKLFPIVQRINITERKEKRELHSTLSISNCTPNDAGQITLIARNRAGTANQTAFLKISGTSKSQLSP